ncbi:MULTISPECIES: glutamate racemase [Pseudomonadaceae]|jgi:glutamate racemase|uniref:Glutamate racemase n=1 Tax=Ectopseudomonas oleovorans TaxID=301 RepID=A0A3D9EDF5_ECTOL|nr:MULTISPECIES: glutamate racemase [Pseudomonas]MBA1260807.1 glutamate racemase [Pseudomonas psychrotolerans]NMZ46623.1 glutamate racemase [Pseudomonas oryzihabitans]RED01006.1 glutamate racemase [Pseudomonas oleovorans]
MAEEAPVGVFDSGVGGLSVLAEIRQLLPAETLHYIADCGHIPYGEKTPAFIRERCQLIAARLHAQGAKALVVACNTATVAAVADLRERYPRWPIVGMEPAVKPAAAATRNGRVGVLATTGTLQSAKFAALLDRFALGVQVVTQPCPGLVEQVERGDLHGPETRRLLQGFLEPLLTAECDTLILGCTHYPFLRPLLAELVPPEIILVDTGAAVARRLQSLLARDARLARGPAGPTRIWTSGEPADLEAVLPQLWPAGAEVKAFV